MLDLGQDEGKVVNEVHVYHLDTIKGILSTPFATSCDSMCIALDVGALYIQQAGVEKVQSTIPTWLPRLFYHIFITVPNFKGKESNHINIFNGIHFITDWNLITIMHLRLSLQLN